MGEVSELHKLDKNRISKEKLSCDTHKQIDVYLINKHIMLRQKDSCFKTIMNDYIIK